MKPILEIKNISKKFRIQHGNQRYLSLRDSISNVFTSKYDKKEDFWALKDICFDVYPGDCIGIVGKNGAGKSTLLKILSKITPPTSGSIISRGRIASLLEVGTGFHPELTGRENVYLNGSIMGLRKSEIDKQFDAIVDFSGVEKFLGTPLKNYSSGMQLRLAFAVAAHLEPEILIIDEVLAVGDAEFQKKCMGKMNDVSKSGRTILFVSHNMGALKKLCTKGVLLEKGGVTALGDIEEIAYKYNSIQSGLNAVVKSNYNSKYISISDISLNNEMHYPCNDYSIGETINLSFKYSLLQQISSLKFCIDIKTFDGSPIAYIVDKDSNYSSPISGDIHLNIEFKDIRLFPNNYIISIFAHDDGATIHYIQLIDILNFNITDGGKYTTRSLPSFAGVIFMTPQWRNLNERG